MVGVVAVYVCAVLGTLYFARWKRKTRWPFKEEDKLLRGPGEQLRRRIAELDESFLFEFMAGFLGPFVAIGIAFSVGKAFKWTPEGVLITAFSAGLAAIALSAWRILRLWQERANYYLGWFGERVVGEQLQLATMHGWRVFHDLPFKNDGAAFNIDHALVGPGGVFVVETKTRRKGNARPGFDDNKVYFDGRDLVWPWGEDNHGLEQAERNALWLTNWIRTEIGERVHVSPILALPGWWLDKKPTRESRLCAVVNPKWLPAMLAKQPAILSPKQIDLIALRLEARCRDVEE